MFNFTSYTSTPNHKYDVHYKKVGISIFLVLVIGLQGCVTTDDSSRTEKEGTVAGSVIGGLLGLALGDSKEAAIVGVAVGAVIGNIYGKHVADKKAEYADTESYMKAVIAESDKVILASREQKNSLKTSLESQKQLIVKLEKESGIQQGVREELAKQVEKNAKDLEVTEVLLTAIDKEIKIQQEVLNEERAQLASVVIDQSEANIASMESEKRQLQLLKSQLASLDYKRVY